MNNAELHPAFVWDCDHCGTENFARGIEGNLDEAALESNEENVGAWMTSDKWTGNEDEAMAPYLISTICLAPKSVKCRECGTEYKPELWSTEDGR